MCIEGLGFSFSGCEKEEAAKQNNTDSCSWSHALLSDLSSFARVASKLTLASSATEHQDNH